VVSLDLVPEEPVRSDGWVELAARFGPERLWFRVPEERVAAGDVTDTMDPFVLAALFHGMRLRLGFRVRGRVSPMLLRGLEEFMALWHAWRPAELSPVPLEAAEEVEPPAATDPGAAVMAFSGGVDSCFTAWRHARGTDAVRRRRERIVAGIVIHGLDRLLETPFDEVFERNGHLLASVGLGAWPVRTNARDLIGPGFYDASGAVALACLLLFQRRAGRGVIGASSSYANLMLPSPSSPVGDHLVETGAMRIVHDGAEALRPEKVAAIADWPEACRYLRVCWEGVDAARNCCRCEKCTRTILNFRAAGRPRPEAFPEDVDDATLRRLRLRYPAAVIGFRNILTLAERNGLGGERWVRLVRRALRRAR